MIDRIPHNLQTRPRAELQLGPAKIGAPPRRLLLALVALWALSLPAFAEPLPLPFRQDFGADPLDTAWMVEVSGTNRISIAEDALKLEADINTYAHIQRPLGVDLVRAACTLQPKGGISWVCSLFLYWDARNWCQVSVLESEPNYYAVELIDGRLHEYRQPFAEKTDWYHVAIALGEDCLRFQSSTNGKSWDNWLLLPRPENWKQPPALLVLGKGFSQDEVANHLTATDLKNDYSERGPRSVSLVREICVERLPAVEARLTEIERKGLTQNGPDWLGEAELAKPLDPSFASVSHYFPPLRYPREALGVKDGPQEFVVLPDGSLDFAGTNASFLVGEPPTRLGKGGCAKRLLEGYLPIVLAESECQGLKFEQTAFGWSPGFNPDNPLSVYVRLKVSNPGPHRRKIPVQFVAPQPVATWDLEVPARGERTLCLLAPFDRPAEGKKIKPAEYSQRLRETADWWKALLARGMKIHVPEQRVNDAWRAWLAYNFINVDKRGSVYEPHDGGGGFYESVFGYSASRYCYALDLMGFPREAQRYLDSILTFVTPEGLLVVNYGLPDTGVQLWAMGQHFRLTHDGDWLRRVAPTMIKMCDWIMATRKSSMAQQPPDAPWHGLIKYRPYCDEANPAYSYHTDTYLALGMAETAAALQGIGLTDSAARIARESEAYHRDILASMERAVLERNGMRMLPMFPETHALLERVGYTGADYYGLVSSMVLETGLVPPKDHPAQLITDLLQRRGGLCLGTCGFQGGIDHAYSLGYWMNCLERDEVKRVILGLYASLAYGMSRDTYAGVEVTFLRTGDNYPTLPHLYSGTQQLLLLRNMLIREDGDQLWLGQAIPRPWLENGKEVRVEDAPTLFGKTSYAIRSSHRARRLKVDLAPPAQPPPKFIRLRLRQPENRAISRVTVNGAAWKDFAGETVTLTGLKGRTTILVSYE